jgi:carbon monoxide dehydrogenase subunit G
MKLEGEFSVGAPRAQVWAKITDPAIVAACIPGCKKIEMLASNRYRAEVVVQVGPVKANFNLVVEVTREEPPERVFSLTRGEEGTRASLLSAQSVITLSENPHGGTQVAYSSEVSLTGRLGKFGLGMMKKKVEAVGNEFAEAFRAKVEAAVSETHSGAP